MLTDCESKECTVGSNVDAKLDEETNKVICSSCGAEIQMSEFTKNMLKSRRDVVQKIDISIPPNGLKYECDNKKCGKPYSAEVDTEKNTVSCPHCKTEARMTSIMIGKLKADKVIVGYTKEYFNEENVLKGNIEVNRQIEEDHQVNSGSVPDPESEKKDTKLVKKAKKKRPETAKVKKKDKIN